MRSIFPDRQAVQLIPQAPLLAREWAWDFDAWEFKLRGGKMYHVYEDEALKVWIWKILATERWKYPVYTWDYGNEYESLIGKTYSKGFIESEAKRIAREAIMRSLSDYVKALNNFKVSYSNHKLYVSFEAETIYNSKVVMEFGI